MAKIVSLKKFFRTREKPLSFKHAHFLNQLSTHRLEEILLFSEGDHIGRIWPNLQKKKTVFLNDQKHKYLFNKVLANQAGSLLNYIYKGEGVSAQNTEYQTIYGDLNRLALRKNHYDVVIGALILEEPDAVAQFLKTVSPLLDNGARLVLSVRHPQFENMVFNQNPSSARVLESSVSQYHTLLKNHGLYLEDMTEGTVDLALKAFFTDSDYDYYHEYKNTPVSLIFRSVKFTRKKEI